MTYLVAEIGQAHDGSLGNAISYIKAAALNGASAVKFQAHLAEYESSVEEKFRAGTFFPQDLSRFEYWKRMEFSSDQWILLSKEARKYNIDFIVTPFCSEAVDLVMDTKPNYLKIGSADINNFELLYKVAKSNIPLILSSGMSTLDEIKFSKNFIEKNGGKIHSILQCTTMYPTTPEYWGISGIKELKNHLNCDIGYSDHSGTIESSISAVISGATLIEVHIVFSRWCFGPDVAASLTIEEFKSLSKALHNIKKSKSNFSKSMITENIIQKVSVFNRAAIYKQQLKKGEILSYDNFRLQKGIDGISGEEVLPLVGKKILLNVNENTPISKEHFIEKN